MERIGTFASEYFDYLVNGFANLFGPTWDAVANALSGAGSLFDTIGVGLETVKFVALEFYREIGVFVGEMVSTAIEWGAAALDAAGAWIEGLAGVKFSSLDVTDTIFAGLEMVGKGLAFVWDSLKAGAGVMAYVTSFIVDGFGTIVDTFKATVADLLNIAGRAADAIPGMSGDWFREQAAGVDTFGERIAGAADAMREWGAGTFDSFGKSAADVDKWFDRIRAKFDASRNAMDGVEGKLKTVRPDKFAGAAFENSTEAYSIVAKFKAAENGAGSKGDTATRQLDETRQTNTLLRDLRKDIQGKKVGVI